MPFEVRASQPEERDEILDMTDAAFERTPREFFDAAWRLDPNDAPELHRVGVLDGRIVSAVRISKKTIHVGCAELTTGGIADVATHPDFRGRGYSTEVLNDCIRFMDESGYHLSMLFTGIQAFYRRLGWEVFPTYHHQFHLLPNPQPPLTLPLTKGEMEGVSTLNPQNAALFDKDKHLEAVAHIYDEFNLTRTATARRDVRYYESTLRWRFDPRAFFVAFDGDEVVAYVRGAFGEEAALHEFGCLPGSEETLRGLVQHFAAEAQANGARRIAVTLPREERVSTVLTQCSESVHVRQGSGMMLRLMGVRRFLEALVPELERRAVAAGHAASFALGICCLNEQVEIRWDDWRITIGDLSNPSLVLYLSPIVLLQFLIGIGAPALASAQMTAEQRSIVEAIANSGEFVYWSADGF